MKSEYYETKDRLPNEYYLTGELKKTYGSRTYPVEYGYDYRGRLTTNVTWQSFATGAGAAKTIWNYDPYGGVLVSKRYNDNKGPSYTYNGNGQVAQRTWARGSYTSYGYNAAREVSTISYTGTPSTPGVTFTYDRLGRVATVVHNSITTTFTYSDDGQLIKEAYSGGDLNGFAITNSFNALGLRSTNRLLLNNTPVATAIYGYDTASRLSTVSDGNNSATYGYLANSRLVQTVTFKEGATTRMTTAKAYDYLNRLTSIASVPSADATVSYAYQYNDANQRKRVTMADGSYWEYQYDKLGQVTSGKKYWSDNTPVAGQQFGYAFDDIGNRTSTTAGGDEYGNNLRSSSYTPNLLNQYTTRSVPNKVDILGSSTNTATVTVNNVRATRKSDYYRSELTLDNSAGPVLLNVTNTAVVNNGPGGLDVVTNSVGTLFVPPATESFTHDDDGNLATDGRWTYVWDTENRLISMTANANVPSAARLKLEFGYDHRGRRTTKKVSNWNGSAYVLQTTTKFLYDGWNLVAEVDGSNTRNRSYLWGSDLSGSLQGAGGVGGLLVVSNAPSGAHFPSYDGNGNVTWLVGAGSGTARASYEYGPFGEVIRASGSAASVNSFRFSTKYQDEETGLLYYGYRYYSASLGRWVSRDPIEEDGGQNIYCFIANKSVGTIDLLGLKEWVLQYDLATDGIPPWGVKRVRSLAEIVADAKAKLETCDCIGMLRIGAHGRPGTITDNVQDGVNISEITFTMYEKAIKNPELLKLKTMKEHYENVEALKTLASLMCKGGKVERSTSLHAVRLHVKRVAIYMHILRRYSMKGVCTGMQCLYLGASSVTCIEWNLSPSMVTTTRLERCSFPVQDEKNSDE